MVGRFRFRRFNRLLRQIEPVRIGLVGRPVLSKTYIILDITYGQIRLSSFIDRLAVRAEKERANFLAAGAAEDPNPVNRIVEEDTVADIQLQHP